MRRERGNRGQETKMARWMKIENIRKDIDRKFGNMRCREGCNIKQNNDILN